jgi:hypothetical protein
MADDDELLNQLLQGIELWQKKRPAGPPSDAEIQMLAAYNRAKQVLEAEQRDKLLRLQGRCS